MFQHGGATLRALAIGNYDFRSSGTVGKSIQIAAACRNAGLPAELWTIRANGPFLDQVPEGLPVVEVGGGMHPSGRSRDLAVNIPAFAGQIRRRRPALILSGGNHFHLPASLASKLSGRRRQLRLGLRASNSSQRPGKTASRLGDRLKYGSGDFIVAVSSELADEVGALKLKGAVSCIPNGVDLGRIRRLAEKGFDHPFFQAGDAPVLVGMGRLSRQKGFDVLLRALAMLPDTLSPRLLLIGEGEARDSLTQLADELGLAERVAFLGFRANPFAILARADLFVSASRWEGSSNALLEALACGLPLVTTDCPTGNLEVMDRGPFGTLARTEDPASLADAIVTELAVNRPREALRRGARHWDIAHCLDEWVDLLSRQYEIAMSREGNR